MTLVALERAFLLRLLSAEGSGFDLSGFQALILEGSCWGRGGKRISGRKGFWRKPNVLLFFLPPPRAFLTLLFRANYFFLFKWM